MLASDAHCVSKCTWLLELVAVAVPVSCCVLVQQGSITCSSSDDRRLQNVEQGCSHGEESAPGAEVLELEGTSSYHWLPGCCVQKQ